MTQAKLEKARTEHVNQLSQKLAQVEEKRVAERNLQKINQRKRLED